jgi:hypothetical protein
MAFLIKCYFIFYFFPKTDLGGSIGSAGSAYSPDGSMGYMMDGGQQFRPPGICIIIFININT